MAIDDEIENENESTDIYDPYSNPQQPPADTQPLFRIYKGSKIPIGKTVGPYWKSLYDSALATYAATYAIWNECFRYYNNSQDKTLDTPLGMFQRGDSTENVIYSNLNIMLPAVYSKDPNFTCSTVDSDDDPYCKTMEAVINQLFRRKDKINAKAKVKRHAGFALLTNLGILKLDWTKKDDSQEMARQEMERIYGAMRQAKSKEQLDFLYGELEGLEANMDSLRPAGPMLSVVLPQNLIIDPYAENSDALDARFMMERVMLKTNYLNAHFTEPDPEAEPDDLQSRVLTYKPTHKAVFAPGEGERDEGLGIVLNAINPDTDVTAHSSDERRAFQGMYYTECVYVWDRAARRVMLFALDDWAWPIWVWDAKELINISRFYPYFITSFGFSTGGTVSPGEIAYTLDQQDEINDINRQLKRIRRSVFDWFYYNSDKIDRAQAEKFIDAIRGKGDPNTPHLLAVKAGDNKITDLIEAVKPPQVEYEILFNKEPIMNSVNRLTNTNDALRGVQFKAYTNQDAVQSYQDSLRLSVGAKVDVLEDTVADVGIALAELAAFHLQDQDVIDLVGQRLAAGWKNMPPEQFQQTYSLEIVAGSMEKPNSEFKKRESIQVAQAIGQFATAAPGSTLIIMLKLMQNAFTDINIKQEDWDLLMQEVQASMQQGVSTGANVGAGAGAGAGGNPQEDQIVQMFKTLPPQEQQKIVAMQKQGVPPQEIVRYVQQQAGQGAPPQQQNGGGGQPTVQ